MVLQHSLGVLESLRHVEGVVKVGIDVVLGPRGRHGHGSEGDRDGDNVSGSELPNYPKLVPADDSGCMRPFVDN